MATQPKIWARLKEHHGAEVKERFLRRLAGEIERRGALDVLRHGIKDSGCAFQLAYFRPASGLNEETRRLYAANLFAAVRQLRYSAKTDHSLDMESYRIQQTSSGPIALERQAGQLAPQRTKGRHEPSPEEIEPLSRIIADLNERFGLNLGPEHRVTLGQMMARLDRDLALDASARVNTRENARLTFDQKVEDVIQEIVDSNFDLYKRITDDPVFGEAVKNLLFDVYLRNHRQAEALLKQHESRTLEFKATLRWNLKEGRKDPAVTQAVVKTIAAFLNTEGGDLLIGVADDRSVLGLDLDGFESEDRFMLHLSQVSRNALGDRAGTCIDPRMQVVQGKTVCVVTCQRSPEPVFLRAKETPEGDPGEFYVRGGPGTVKLSQPDTQAYIRTRFPTRSTS